MSLLTRERPWQDALFFPRQLPGSGDADFHILDCEFASKVGILRRRPVQRRFLAPQNVHVLLSVRLYLPESSGGLAGSSRMCSFLTKPKQLIKFDLIVPISINLQVLTR
jgi:hypothetical protein